MALIPTTPVGSGTTSSGRNDLPPHPNSAVVSSLPTLDGKALTNESVVQRSHLNNTAYNIDSYRNKTDLVEGYPEGRVIVVTYYSNAVRPADTVSHTTYMSTDANINDVHSSWVEIRNLEIRCREEFKFQYNEESNLSQLDSSGLTLPGFEPMIGDIFLYAISGKVGVFTISNVTRLALDTNTYHEISFTLTRWVDSEYRDKLIKQRVDIRYFDKVKYLSGNTSLLTTDAYQYQVDLFRFRKEIITDYISRFYQNNMDSFVRPDGVYDPYAVEFFRIKVSSIDHTSGYPIQLLMAMSNYKKTIFGLLTNNPIKNLKNVDRYCWIGTMHNSLWSTNITSLIDREYLLVGNEAAAYSTSPLYAGFGNAIKPHLASKCNPHMHHPHEGHTPCRSFSDVMNDVMDKANAAREEELANADKYIGPQELPYRDRDVAVTDSNELMFPPRLTEDGLNIVVYDSDTPLDPDTGFPVIPELEPEEVPVAPVTDPDVKPGCACNSVYEACKKYKEAHHYPHEHHWSLGLRAQHHHHHPHCCGHHDTECHAPEEPKDPNRHGIEFEDHHHCSSHHHHHPHCCNCKCNDPTYVLSDYFYDGVIDKMSHVEALLYKTITNKEINVSNIYAYVYEYLERDDMEAFYSHLFAIYLIDKALYWIRFHS